MISIAPTISISTTRCPHCDGTLRPQDWHIVGTRTIAQSQCDSCQRTYYEDLAVGHGTHTRGLYDAQAQQLVNHDAPNWYTDAWHTLFKERSRTPIALDIETLRPLGDKPIILLNTIDAYYGHSLLKLLNAQYHIDHQPDDDVVVLVQPFMRWLVPDGVAQIITAPIPLRAGDAWYDDLDAQLHTHFAPYKRIAFSRAFSHPDAADFDIARFTGVQPFDIQKWHDSPLNVTFIWRDDRTWHHPIPISKWRNIFVRRPDNLTQQKRRFVRFAHELRRLNPDAQLTLIGTTSANQQAIPDLPQWVIDKRATQMNESIERQWVQQYARSQIVVGVHGSNMLLPTAHAGASITLMPVDRWDNIVQDTIVAERDPRMAQVRHKHISLDTLPQTLARIIVRTYRALPLSRRLYERPHTEHGRYSTP